MISVPLLFCYTCVNNKKARLFYIYIISFIDYSVDVNMVVMKIYILQRPDLLKYFLD